MWSYTPERRHPLVGRRVEWDGVEYDKDNRAADPVTVKKRGVVLDVRVDLSPHENRRHQGWWLLIREDEGRLVERPVSCGFWVLEGE